MTELFFGHSRPCHCAFSEESDWIAKRL